MANRTTIMGGIWADGAPDPPSGSPPAADTTYANSLIETSAITAGWPHLAVVDSADHNEIMRRVTTLLGLVESNGVLPWCATTTYSQGALAVGSDQAVYQSKSSSNLNHDPTTSSTYWFARTGNMLGVQIFDVAGTYTYTPTTGAKNALVEVLGGGGGGAGTRDTDVTKNKASTGGGAGGYAKKWVTGVTTQTVIVGAGGTGGAKTADGTAGGTSSFGSIISCTGGSGGGCPTDLTYGSYLNGAVGGTAVGGDINVPGKCSDSAWASSASTFFPNAQGSPGADSQYGVGGRSLLNTDSEDGTGHGSGGGASSTGASQSGNSGGDGTCGLVIIWEYA